MEDETTKMTRKECHCNNKTLAKQGLPIFIKNEREKAQKPETGTFCGLSVCSASGLQTN